MTRNPLDPITVGKNGICPTSGGFIRIDGQSGLYACFAPSDAPAVANAILTIAREMGADVPDPDAVIRGLVDALGKVTRSRCWSDAPPWRCSMRLKPLSPPRGLIWRGAQPLRRMRERRNE